MPRLYSQESSQKQQKELAKEQKKFVKLQQHLPSQKGIKQAQTLAEMAQLSVDFARASYEGGDAAHGAAQLKSAQSYAAQAMQIVRQQAATRDTGGMKKVELAFQECAFELRALSMSVEFRQRSAIDAAQHYFSAQREQILSLMFAPPKEKK